jgi:hypothetical protein
MGVISITQRRESLGNIGGTSAAHGVTNTNIGQVHHAVAQTFAPRYFRTNSHAGDAALAEGLGRLGGAMTRIGAAIVQREEDRKVDDYANAMMDNMEKMGRDDREVDDWNTPDRKHLQGQKRGFYLRTGEGTKTVVDEWDKAFGDTFRKIGDSIGANDRVRERTMERLANYRRSTVSRLADHQASEYRRMELDAAKGNLATQRMIWKNGRTEVLPDIFTQQDRLDALNLATPETRKANREALAVQLAADFVDNSLQQCASGEDFDKVEEAVKGGLKDRLPDLIAANLPGGSRTLDGEYRKALLGEVKKARQSFSILRDREEREQVAELSLFSANAIAKGGIDGLEAACSEMSARAAKMPKGSRLETVALQEAKRLDKAADAEAKRLTWDGILDHVGDKEEWKPPKGSRMERHYKQLKESFDRQAAAYAAEGMLAEASAVQEERKANYATLRAAMLDAAAVDPGGFSARLAEAAEKGHVTLDQYRKLRDEFRDVWTKEGMPQKGAALVQILKNEFYAGRDYDLNDRLAVNPKTGRFEYVKNPDTKKPFEGEDVEFEAQVLVPYDPNSWGGLKDFLGINRASHYEAQTRTITSDEQLKMLDWAMELAQHDGEWISTDPQTGAKLDKPRKLDAAAEFQDACSRLRTSKRAQSSQELVLERANAMLSLRAGFAQADDAVTGTAAKREAVELKTRETLKSAKRKPFAPKMPGDSRGESAASDGEED